MLEKAINYTAKNDNNDLNNSEFFAEILRWLLAEAVGAELAELRWRNL
jgi:hypothetical protein